MVFGRSLAPLPPIVTLRNVVIAVLVLGAAAGLYRVWSIHAAMVRMESGGIETFIGPKDAKNVVVEFMDYRCHACRLMAPTMAEFAKNHPDVKIVFRHFPMYMGLSVKEADMALAAALQGKFMAMHTYLLSREQPVEDAEIPAIAAQLGLDADKLKADLHSHPVTRQLLDNVDSVYLLNIQMAPSFLFNRTVYIPPGHVPDINKLETLYRPYHKK